QITRDHRRDHYRSGDQGYAHSLSRGKNRGGEEHNEEEVNPSRRYAVGVGHFRVKSGEKKRPAYHKKSREDDKGYRCHYPEILGGDAENVAEQGRLDVPGETPVGRDNRNADRKTSGGHDSYRGVGSHPATPADGMDEGAGKQSPETGANIE